LVKNRIGNDKNGIDAPKSVFNSLPVLEAFLKTIESGIQIRKNDKGGVKMEPIAKVEEVKPPKIVSATAFQDSRVTNVRGDDLGKVEAIMLDIEKGRIAYVALSSGRANWFPNDKLLAVPWEAMSISFHDKKFLLNVSEETIKSAEGFDRKKWPDTGDFEWLARVYLKFGREPYWK
jgi:sporulation protein YlmC with PRC-barrel domain